MRVLLTTSLLSLAAACASAPVDDGLDGIGFAGAVAFEEDPLWPVEIVETAVPLPLPGQMKEIAPAVLTPEVPPEEAIEEGRREALIEPTIDGYVNAIQVYPYTEGALYRLYASPGQVSDIALQAGEMLVSVSAGDTVRWVVGDTVSGTGETARAHVLVKPIKAGLRTNLMIATDRRTYHLELESVESGYMAALSWRYPADELAGLVARNDRALKREAVSIERGVALDGLNFEYRLTGDNPDWKPLRVFDDGRQVFIQMPPSIAATDLPPLFILNASGRAELVNYRVRGNFYIVDRLFRAAELRLGEKPQTVVRIVRRERAGSVAASGKR
jgi:type IV secretion system protein VirB9